MSDLISIDEAIHKHKKLKIFAEGTNDKRAKEEHEQIAEWLEELKVYQQHEIICNKGYNAGYNKAIDDFAEKLKPIIDEKIKGWTNSDDLRRWCERSIDEIAEQLKAGAGNGTD